MTTISASNSQPVAVDHKHCMRADMENAPIGVKLLLINLGGVLVPGTITESTRGDFLEWQYVLKRAKHNPVESQRPKK